MDVLPLGSNGVVQVDLSRGFVAVVDAERFEQTLTYHFCDGREFAARPSSLTWWTTKSKCRFYAVAFVKQGGERWGLKLHRLLIEAPSSKLVDHISGNTMDNRLANLRVCSLSESNRNRTRLGGGQFKGVKNRRGRFFARLSKDGHENYLGTFATPEAAARAYDAAAIEHFGEFARLNFPVESDRSLYRVERVGEA